MIHQGKNENLPRRSQWRGDYSFPTHPGWVYTAIKPCSIHFDTCVCVYIYIYILLHTFINLSLKSSHYLKKVDSNHPQLISVQCPPKWEDFEFMFTKSSQMCTEQRTRLWDPPTELWESEFKPSQCSQRRIRVCINIAIWIYIYIYVCTHTW